MNCIMRAHSSLDGPEHVPTAISHGTDAVKPEFPGKPGRSFFPKGILDRKGAAFPCLIAKANRGTHGACFQLVVYVPFTLSQKNVPRCDIYEPHQLGAVHTSRFACGVGK